MNTTVNAGKSVMTEGSFLKGLLYFFIGIFSYPGLVIFNRLKVKGMDKLAHLPDQKVLFVSNHQTYFTDVICMIHIFCAVKWKRKKGLGFPFYLLSPKTNIKYIAASSTMKKNWMSRLLTKAGGITVKRAWNEHSGEQLSGLEISDTRTITRALEENWVITFPQGTTTPYAPSRKGTAFIIRHSKPIVVPVVINGFSKAFHKTGLKLNQWNTQLEVTFKDPLCINFDDPNEIILQQIMDAIEQSERFAPRI